MACISWPSLQKARPTIKRILISCLPHVLLCFTHLSYLIVGTLILQAIEGTGSTQLEEYQENIMRMRKKLEYAMWNETHGFHATNWTLLLDEYTEFVTRPEWKLGRLQAVTNGVAWSFSSTMLFCLITITTIGYGDIVPVTSGGRIFVGFYAAFGIPLNVIFLADIGFLMAKLVVGIISTWNMYLNNRTGAAPKRTMKPPIKGMRGPRRIRKPHHNGMAQSQRLSVYGPRSVVTLSTDDNADTAQPVYSLKRSRTSTKGSHGGISACSMMSIHGPKSLVNHEMGMCDTKHGSVYPQLHETAFTKGQKRTKEVCRENIALQDLPSPDGTSRHSQISESHLVKSIEPPNNVDITLKTIDNNVDNNKGQEPTEVVISKAEEAASDRESETEVGVDMEVPLIIVLLILILYMLLGSCLMAVIEDWDYNEAVYFTFITLTTIGYGDIVPNNHYQDRYFFISIIYTVLGLAVMSTCIALAQGKVLRAIDRFTLWIKSHAE